MLTSKKLWFAVLSVAVLAAYSIGLRGDLIFDDQRLADGTIFGSYGSFLEIQARSLSYGSFVWLQELFGEGWWKQRLVNVLLHLGVAMGLYLLVRTLIDQVQWHDPGNLAPSDFARSKDAAAGFGVLLFAFNPVAAYAVTYLVQRSIVMATLFSVIGLYLTARAAVTGRWVLLIAAFLAYAAAVLSKEHAVMVPLVALAVFLIARRLARKNLWMVVGSCMLLVLGAGGFLAAQYGAILGEAFDAISRGYVSQLAALKPGIEENILIISVANQAWLFFRYGLLWFLPYTGWMSMDLRPAFPLEISSVPQVFGIPLYLGVALGSLFLMIRFKDWRRFLGLGLFAPAALFATEFATVWIQDPFVLYRSYLWAIGVPFLGSLLFVGTRPKTIAIATIVVGTVLAGLTVERILSLKTEAVAWADAAEKVDLSAPANAVGRWRPLVNRGNQYLQRDMLNVALADYETAIRTGDPTGLAEYHRGIVLRRLGRSDEALEAFLAAGTKPAMPKAFTGLPHLEAAKILFAQHDYERAVAEIDTAWAGLSDNDNRLMALKIRAQSNMKGGRARAAVADYQKAVALDPANRSTRVGLALALNDSGQREAALNVLDSLKQESDGWDVRFGRAIILESAGLTDQAREDARIALELNPGDPLLQAFSRKLGLKR